MTSQAYVDGEYGPVDEATVSIRDRGFLFGDGIYEVVRLVAGTYFRLDRHLDRLLASARALEFRGLPEADRIRRIAEELAERSSLADGKLYVQVTRGSGPRTATYPDDSDPTIAMYVEEVRRGADAIRSDGASVRTVPEMRWTRCDIKSTNLLPKVLMKQRAFRTGCYEAIFVSESGVVWEGTSTNVCVVREGTILTTDHDQRVLPGITRREIVEIAAARDIPVELSRLRLGDLYASDEVFLTGTLTGVLGVVEVDGREVGGGEVGPVAEMLHDALVGRRREACT